ncbi:MAG: hypothetical protein SV375_23275 [Thermodesulfobacteriota bacterium]|nr:hypothetical protein [Thermodesulfobacteriota bacterium]
MEMLTVPIKVFWVTCREDDDLDEEFGASQFDAAGNYLNEQRRLWPKKTIEMIAEIDA